MIRLELHNETVDGLHEDLRALLAGTSVGTIAAIGGAGVGQQTEKPPTAAQKKAAEKAAKEAAEAAAKAAQQAISTGEERIDPAADKQDAADEKAETAVTKTVDLTHDDVKKLLGGYVMAYGMEAAQADGVSMISAPKISEIPSDQKALAKAILGIAKALNDNTFKRDLNGDGLTAEKTAELKPIVQAAMAVK